jgi:predicted transcriptional regulator
VGVSKRAAEDGHEAFEENFQRAFSLVAFITNRHIVDHMVRFRRAFDLDFEALVLWAVLAHQNCVHLFPPGALPSQVLDAEGRLKDVDALGLRPLRLRHLSEITGIPRETTRRKLAILKEAGWIVQVRDGWLVNRDKVGPELRAFTLETVRRLLATAREVERALASAGDAGRR